MRGCKMAQEITVIDAASQSLSFTVSDKRVGMALNFNTTIERWSFDLTINEVLVISGRRIVAGIDMLSPFSDLGIGRLVAIGDTPSRQSFNEGKTRLLIE